MSSRYAILLLGMMKLVLRIMLPDLQACYAKVEFWECLCGEDHLPFCLQNYVDVLSSLLQRARQDPAGPESLQLQGLVKEIARLSQVCFAVLVPAVAEKQIPSFWKPFCPHTLIQSDFKSRSKRLKLLT